MSKALYKAAALEARLAELAGPEWASDDEADAAAGLGGKKTKDFVAVDGAAKKKQKGKERKAAKGAPAASSGVVYLGHIPHGFYEDQMRGFFGQFGDIVRLRLSRSKKTAKSRGYAFIEFDSKEVAGIVAETMNGYYLEGRKLVCHVMDPKDIHERLFDGANRTFQKISWRKLERERVNKPKTEEGIKKCTDRRLSSESKKRQRLAELGIDYDFPGLAGALKEAGEAGEEKEEKVERPKKRAATGEIKPAAKKPATASTTQAAAKPAEGEKEEGKAGKAKKRPRQEEAAKPEEQEEEAEKPKVVKKVKGKAAAPAEPAVKKQPAAEAKPSGAVKEKPAAKAKKAAAAAPPAKKEPVATKTAAKKGTAGGKTKPAAKKAGSKK